MIRNEYDLSHYIAKPFRLGRLQTLSCVPVLPNDSMAMDLVGALRLSPLLRPVQLDCKVDIFTFYVKHRHIYGDTWVDFLKEGIDGTAAATTLNAMVHSTGGTGANNLGYLPANAAYTNNLPKWLYGGYARIWNEYFRVPAANTGADSDIWDDMLDEDEMFDSAYPVSDGNMFARNYGMLVARLPANWTTGVYQDTDTTAQYVDATAGGGTDIELVDIVQAQALFGSKNDRTWFSERYRDLIQSSFGSRGVSIDADDRPELCAHTQTWLSGYDLPTYDSYGNVVGRQEGMVNHSMSMKYFNEHGTLWTMAVLRFPPILVQNYHYCITHPSFDYKTHAGDPRVTVSERPVELTQDDICMDNSSSGTTGFHPYHDWFRWHPDNIDWHFSQTGWEGWPFINSNDFGGVNNISLYECVYENDYWANFFAADTYGHAQLMAKCNLIAKRIIPASSQSIDAGLNFHAVKAV